MITSKRKPTRNKHGRSSKNRASSQHCMDLNEHPSSSRFSTFKFDYSNVRSYKKKFNLVSNHIINNNLDLFFCTESWLNSSIGDSVICPDGYSVVRSDRMSRHGGGCMVLHKNTTNITTVNIPTCNNFEILCIDVYVNKASIRFICVYLPPASSTEVVMSLCNVISSLLINSPTYIVGDFNLPNINWKIPFSSGNKSHDIFLSFCNNNALTQLLTEPTHEKGNILDLLICNNTAKPLATSFVISAPLSANCDHFLLSVTLTLPAMSYSSKNTQFRDYTRASYTDLCADFTAANWDHLYSIDNCQEAYDYLNSILMSSISVHVPLIKSRAQNKPRKPPLTIQKLLKEKLRLYKQSKADKSLKARYKNKAKEYDKTVNSWYDKRELNLCSNPSNKKFYHFVNKKLNIKQFIPPLLNDSGELVFDDSDKASLLNKCFQKAYTKDDGTLPSVMAKQCEMMKDFEITEADILEACQNLKDKLSRTPDEIPSFFIKRTVHSYIKPLTHVFNLSLKQGIVPSQWKSAIVIPIFKKGSKSSPGNYRPVSLTSSFSRLFELILNSKILQHLFSNDLMSPHQFGFLKGRSSCSQLLFCLQDWIDSFSNNCATHVIYTDLAKAFDSISHPKLLSVLESYGLSPQVIRWIDSFLQDRTQKVVIKSSYSNLLPVDSGVVQGSILGPLMFLIYINEIDSQVTQLERNGGIALFADDTKVYSTDPIQLQNSLDQMQEWFSSRQLVVAPHKCFHLQISKPRQRRTQTSFTICNVDIANTQQMRDLGIMISENLKWSSHIAKITRESAFISCQIINGFRSNSIWTLMKLYKTYIRPKLEHNCPVWSPSYAKDIRAIESIQRRYTRFACRRCGIKFKSYAHRLYMLNLKSLEYRRAEFDLIYMFKIVHDLCFLNFSSYFTATTHNYNLRRNSFQIKPIHSYPNQVWTQCFFSRTPKLWNKLPEHLISATDLPTFRRRLKSFDLNTILQTEHDCMVSP